MHYIIQLIEWIGAGIGWIFSTFDRLFSAILLATAIVFMIITKPLLDALIRESRDDEIYDDWQDVRDALRLQATIARRKLASYRKGNNENHH